MVKLVAALVGTVALLAFAAATASAYRPGGCEVCLKAVETIQASCSAKELTDMNAIEAKTREFCASATGKDNRWCYFVGGTEDAATGLLREVSRPISLGLPKEKVCERLEKRDPQICDLKYDKPIDLNAIDVNTLRVRELKKVVNDLNLDCKGCAEKADFVKRINDYKKTLKPEL
ncbi:hypothetical protein CAOG_03757 [Capsaspora owczarzaki ATCC 30864]|uniref:Mesencephalic astrocyte-derived neurotrophic factor homolog n=1 Tax=Capsaspora owczarzaki (strain ATCC 30864) TaxID=595528 RepID=A0A0D2UCT3_CAPO3|nr:hypothetical protein CAOG_03757 [Capsaspora owczarzaki ATCC 30864]KJE92866.1 hypothetical protein CAOG_003757 [Capsaspora owczarzaki ATCC 30864]|eukprot:XP_004363485.1 hypothetical protein CAOG_03757 [Capsaspora owczarzaki ATCC 30864]